MNDETRTRALEAIGASISVHTAIQEKLDQIIAKRKFRRLNVDKERSLKASIIQRLWRLRMRLLNVEAAEVIVSAPTVEEIAEVQSLIKEIQSDALANAGRRAIIRFLSDARNSATNLRNQVTI